MMLRDLDFIVRVKKKSGSKVSLFFFFSFGFQGALTLVN